MQHGPLRISTNLILQQRWRNFCRLLVGKLLFTWWVGVGGPFGGDARPENKWKKSNFATLHLQKTLPHKHAQARSQRTRAKQTVTRKRHNGGLQPPRLDTTSRLVMVMFVVCVTVWTHQKLMSPRLRAISTHYILLPCSKINFGFVIVYKLPNTVLIGAPHQKVSSK